MREPGARRPIEPLKLAADGRVAFYRGDGSERCAVCGSRSAPSLYVGQVGQRTEEGWPERFPVCNVRHGLLFIKSVIVVCIDRELGQ